MSSLRSPIEDGSSSIAVPFKYKYLIFLEKSGNLLIDEQPEMSAIRRDFNKYMFSGRFTRSLQFFKFNATSPPSSPIDWGSSSTAVSFKFKYVSFLAVSGHFLRFEQPERLRLFRHLELILPGRLIRLVQHLKSKSISLSRCCIDKGTLTKLVQN
jgi:hypothetical protein